ncbi:hypothetical protein BJX70DRAFT_355659 [Aspergillus crustosus]
MSLIQLLERWIYTIPPYPERPRTKPMEVLALGMSRSGTESLRRALQLLGYDHVYHGFDMSEATPMHWKHWALLGRRKYGLVGTTHKGDPHLTRADFDQLLGHSVAVTDQPCSIFAPELINAYPEAKVILNYRDVDSWYESLTALILPHAQGFWYNVLPWFSAEMYWAVQYTVHCFNKFFYDSLERNGKWVYEQHSAQIKGLVADQPGRLLVWRVQDGWESLCKFLDKPIPEEEFPSGNTLDTTNKRYDKNMVSVGLKAARNFFIFLILVGIATAYYAMPVLDFLSRVRIVVD